MTNNDVMKSILTKNLPDDLYNITLSYFKEGERLYYSDKWNLIDESHIEILLIEDRKLWSLYLKKYRCEAFVIACAKSGSLSALKWIGTKTRRRCVNKYICAYAAEGGHLEVLKWLRVNRYPWDKITCTNAAFHGHLKLLQWARKNGCPWDENTCSYSAFHGHLKLLQWARKNGCPWNEETCAFAAEGGHSELLEWAKKNGCPSGKKRM